MVFALIVGCDLSKNIFGQTLTVVCDTAAPLGAPLLSRGGEVLAQVVGSDLLISQVFVAGYASCKSHRLYITGWYNILISQTELLCYSCV